MAVRRALELGEAQQPWAPRRSTTRAPLPPAATEATPSEAQGFPAATSPPSRPLATAPPTLGRPGGFQSGSTRSHSTLRPWLHSSVPNRQDLAQPLADRGGSVRPPSCSRYELGDANARTDRRQRLHPTSIESRVSPNRLQAVFGFGPRYLHPGWAVRKTLRCAKRSSHFSTLWPTSVLAPLWASSQKTT